MKAGALKIKILRAGSGAVVANESAKNLARNKTEAKDLNSLLNSKGIKNKQFSNELDGKLETAIQRDGISVFGLVIQLHPAIPDVKGPTNFICYW